MALPRPLLMPWLREQIDSGRYPGVQWTNLEKTEFSIPWKHGLRQDSSDFDILIFKAWAEVSGNGRAQGDSSIWKRNFRSALRAKGFKLVSDNKNDAANPHKVFRWPDESHSDKSPTGSQDKDDSDLLEDSGLLTPDTQGVPCFEECLYIPVGSVFSDPPAGHDILQQCLEGLNIGPEAEGTAGFESPPEQQRQQNAMVIGAHPLPGQQQYPVEIEGAANEAGLPGQPAHPVEGAVGGVNDGQAVAQFLQTMRETYDGDYFSTQFKVSVYYRGVKVSEQLVDNEAGFRLVYRPGLNGTILDPESGLSLVSLPSPGAMLDKTQMNLTQRILDNLGDGLDVGVSGYVIYGQRRGEIKAFWSFSKFDQNKPPQEVSKLHPQPLYLCREFIKGIKEFTEDKACPPCSLFLCLGEKWPDLDNRPWTKKLITVEVVLTSMELLRNFVIEGGASSLQSVELQMSFGEMMELC